MAFSNNDRLINQLPDDIVLSSILSRLTINQLALTRLLSRHWNHSWHYIPSLHFENPIALLAMQKIRFNKQLLENKRYRFVYGIHHFIRLYMGYCIDQFKISFELNNTYQTHIDLWVIWALMRKVRILDLDFYPAQPLFYTDAAARYHLHPPLIEYCYFTWQARPPLTCLSLKNVNVCTQVVEILLGSCSFTLESFCIEQSEYLTSIGPKSLPSLKYFKVYGCRFMQTIDITAPKLESFTYYGSPLAMLQIAKASSISQICIGVDGGFNNTIELIFCVFCKVFARLEHLRVRSYLCPLSKRENYFDAESTDLEHVEFSVKNDGDITLSGYRHTNSQSTFKRLSCIYLPFGVRP